MALVLFRVTDPRGAVTPDGVDYQYGQTFFADPRSVEGLLLQSLIAPVPPTPNPLITSNGLTLPAPGLGPVGPPGPTGPPGPAGSGSSETLNDAYTLGNIITVTAGHPVTINKSVVDATTALVVDVTGGSGLAADITGSVNISGALSMSNHLITNVLAPSAGTDAANKTYVDTKPSHSLGTTGSPVIVDAAAPPSTGQVLTATSPTNATWQTPSSGGGGTLDSSYDFGGPGAGRAIIADADAVTLVGGNDAHNILEIYKDPGGGVFAGDGVHVFVGVNTTGNGVHVDVGGGSGLAGLFEGASISVPHTGTASERFGADAIAPHNNATALGNGAIADNLNDTAIGAAAATSNGFGTDNTVIGYNSFAEGGHTVVIGSGARTFLSQDSVIVGYNAQSNNFNTVLIGSNTYGDFDSQYSIVIGSGASDYNGPNSVVIGSFATSTSDYNVIIGDSATSGSHGNGVPGFSVVIGGKAFLAPTNPSNYYAQFNTVVGYGANSPQNSLQTVILGANASADNIHENYGRSPIAIGGRDQSFIPQAMLVGVDLTGLTYGSGGSLDGANLTLSPNGLGPYTVNFGTPNVPQDVLDSINNLLNTFGLHGVIALMDKSHALVLNTPSDGATQPTLQVLTSTAPDAAPVLGLPITTITGGNGGGTYTASGIMIGSGQDLGGNTSLGFGISTSYSFFDNILIATTSANGLIGVAAGSQNVVIGDTNLSGIGTNLNNSVLIGNLATMSEAVVTSAVLVGYQATGSNNSVGVGGQVVASGVDVVAIGYQAHAEQDRSVVIGTRADVDQPDVVVIGYQAYSGESASGSVAIGSGAALHGDHSIALGFGATIADLAASNSIAIGAGATVTGGQHNILLGRDASNLNANGAPQANTFVAGSPNHPVNIVYFGSGIGDPTATSIPSACTILGSGGNLNAPFGGNLAIQGGPYYNGASGAPGGTLTLTTLGSELTILSDWDSNVGIQPNNRVTIQGVGDGTTTTDGVRITTRTPGSPSSGTSGAISVTTGNASSSGNITIQSGSGFTTSGNVSVDTGNGGGGGLVKLGTLNATSVSVTRPGGALSFFGAAPVGQQTAIASPAGGGTVDTEGRAAIDSILAVLQSYGLTA